MKPIQPYFVLATDQYLKRPTDDTLVSHFYRFTATKASEKHQLTVPDGATDIIFACDANDPGALVCGTVSHGTPSPFETGRTYFGVRFAPGVLEHFGNASAGELADHTYSLADLLGSAELPELIADESNFDRQIDLFRMHCSAHLACEKNDVVCELLALIEARNGNVRVEDLERELCYSRRHLSRVFRACTGIGLKSFCRYVRFQSALACIRDERPASMGNLAARCGYYDQSHFQREFNEFASLSPAAYVTTLQAGGYFDHLQVV